MGKDVTQIIAAGTALETAGKPVNGTALRRALGGEGRPDALLRVWETHEQTQMARPAALDLLIEQALSALRQLLERLAEASWTGASDGLAARARELEAQLREAEEELGATIDRYDRAGAHATARIADLESALAAAHNQHQAERQMLQDKVRVLEEQLAARNDERQTVRALADLLPTLQQAVATRPPSPDGDGKTKRRRSRRAQTNKHTVGSPLLDAITASTAVGPSTFPP